jgi:hypothetical protein
MDPEIAKDADGVMHDPKYVLPMAENTTGINIIAYVSLAIPGKPLIVLADPLGKAFSCVESVAAYADGIRSEIIYFKRVAPANQDELIKLHARHGGHVSLAKKEWFEVVTD